MLWYHRWRSLQCASKCILRELFRLLHLTRAPHHFVRLAAGARADLAWWWCFLKEWNGSSFFPRSEADFWWCFLKEWNGSSFFPRSEADFHVWSDASRSFGCRAVVDCTAMFQLAWPVSWDSIDISVKELVPVVVATALWGRNGDRGMCAFTQITWQWCRLSNQGLLVLSSPCTYCAACFYCAFYRFSMSCVHVPGALNTVADALSRDNFEVVYCCLPQASLECVPAAIVELLVTTRPDWWSPAWTDLFTRSVAPR